MKKVSLALCLISACVTCPAGSDESAPSIPFDQALAEILQRSTSIAAQQANLRSVQASNLPTRFFFAPSIALEAKQGKGETSGLGSDGKQLLATSKLNLFRFGADLAALGAANSEELRQESLLAMEVLKAEDEAAMALLSGLSNHKRVEILKKLVGIQEYSLKIANERYRRGLLPIQEAEKLSVDLENGKSRLIDAEIGEYEARSGLTTLLGHANVAPEWPWKDRFRSDASHSLLQTQLSLPERPDFRAAEARVEAENQRYRQRQRSIFPSLDASVSYGHSSGLFGGGTDGSTGWTGVLSLSIPLFDRLSNYSSARAQSFVRDSAEFNLEQVRRTARSEWEGAKKSFHAALTSAISREKTLEVSRKLYADNLKRFQSGRINANEFAVDQNRLFDSELFSVQGWSMAHLAYARFCHSLGRRISTCQK